MRRLPFPLVPRALRWLGVLAVLGVIGHFSLGAVPPAPPEPTPFWDKRLHFAAYAGLGLSLAYATVGADDASRRVAVVLGGALAFGALVELLQGTLPNRYFGWGDLLANCLGAALSSLWFAVEPRLAYVRLPRRGRS
ncbi:VanZ family protein [Halorarum halobium]|uniref:VanZ family protein n=1 Tax=Halorarum halobium TaxID=3075121 RepID=UPI0028A808F4|nr:VanZ family protein [Halobaculum sp. XH14]